MNFAGLSAFPLTPMDERGVGESAFVGLVSRLAEAGVDSIGALGSTGNYAYLTRGERSRVARLAVEAAGGIPVMVSVGSARTSHVLELVEDAQAAGAAALLLAPVSYQPLRTDEAFELYAEVDRPRRRRPRRRIGSAGSGSSSRRTEACVSWPPRPPARLGLTQTVNLPRPLRPLDGAAQHQLDRVLARLGLLTRTKEGPPCTQ